MKEEIIEWGLFYPFMSRMDLSYDVSKCGKLAKVVYSEDNKERWCGMREHFQTALNCIIKEDYEECRKELEKYAILPIEAKSLKGFIDQIKKHSMVLTIWKVGKVRLRGKQDFLPQLRDIKARDLVFEKDHVKLMHEETPIAEYYII